MIPVELGGTVAMIRLQNPWRATGTLAEMIMDAQANGILIGIAYSAGQDGDNETSEAAIQLAFLQGCYVQRLLSNDDYRVAILTPPY